MLDTWEERDQKLQERLNKDSDEQAWLSLGCIGAGFLTALGITYGFQTCILDSSSDELEKQYKTCTSYLEKTDNDEVKRFIYDEIFVVQGPYQGKTCREITDTHSKIK